MTFKDLVRLLRRRWLVAAAVAAVVFAGFMTYSRLGEKTSFRARTRVLIGAPTLLVSNAPGTQFISVQQLEPRTWHSIITSRQIREAAEKSLRERVEREKLGYAVQASWFAGVTAAPETGSQFTWIEASGPTAQIATDVVNTVAQEIVLYSLSEATRDLRAARENAQKQRDHEARTAAREDDSARKIRDDARTRLASENLEVEVRKLGEETQSHDARRREIERRLASNRLRLERVKADRSVAEHLRREGAPRVTTASAEARVQDNAEVKRLTDRLEVLHRDLILALRRYTEEHPQVIALRADIRQGELDHTRSRMDALGRDIDREELALRSDSELAAIELKVLEPEARSLRDRLAQLTPLLDEVRARERAAQEARARASAFDAQIAQLATTPESGYVKVLDRDRALPDEALRLETKLGRSWPVALVAAWILGLSFAFLVEFVDTTLRTDYDIRRHLDYPVLAVVPKVARGELVPVHAARSSALPEIFDTLATVLLSSPSDRTSRLFLVTSTNPKEGKTASSTHLAVALARQGRRTLLVDADLRVPSVHSVLALPNASGLSELLSGAVQLDGEGVVQATEIPNLAVITSGVAVDNPYELLDPARFGPLVAQARQHYDAIVVDTPPVLRTGDALKLSAAADQVLFVVESGKTDLRQATWAKRLLQNVGARVAGVILNRAVTETEEYYYYYGYSTPGRRKEARSA